MTTTADRHVRQAQMRPTFAQVRYGGQTDPKGKR